LLFACAFVCVVFAGHVEPVLGNTDGVTSIFRPLSQPAQEIKELSLLVLAICGTIFAVVAGLLVYAIIRFRHRAGDELSEPPQVYGSNQIELAWIVLPLLIVFVLILVTSRTIADIQNRKPPPTAVQATVVGHQWWWEIRYPELGIVTANELHVPASDGRGSYSEPRKPDVDRADKTWNLPGQLRGILRHTARTNVDTSRGASARRV
jgi:cytochrome c oxidase subunit 2